MVTLPFTLMNSEGQKVFVNYWVQDPEHAPRGIVQISHGMAETSARYERFARELTAQGFAVYANDHRGHGKTAGYPEYLGYAGPDGHNGMVDDLLLLGSEIRLRHAGIPLFLLGHSMGSFLVQKTMYLSPEPYTGFLLTGSCGGQGGLAAGQLLASAQVRLQGAQHPSLLLNALVFGRYNRQFAPVRTPFDWLTRDQTEVDKFIEDPFCGALCSAGFFYDFFGLLREIHRPEHMAKIPKDKPVFIFSGEEDPVGLNGKGVHRLIEAYKELGLEQVDWKLYPHARHELLNELNRDEVTEDVLYWLNRQLQLSSSSAPSD
ncbi:alpha/beta hydrolase [Paenibacillus sp. CAA11]|nr:alpha/beta hydrolase [Paenibacillus sp. CAA11]